MVVGIDVYHDKASSSVGGFVASINPGITRWYSRTCFQGRGQELIDGLKVCLTQALKKYHSVSVFVIACTILKFKNLCWGQIPADSMLERLNFLGKSVVLLQQFIKKLSPWKAPDTLYDMLCAMLVKYFK